MVFGVIGGDRRQAELAALLVADGKEVCTYGLERWKAVGAADLEQVAASDVILLPLPLCRGDGVLNCEEAPMPTADLFRRLRPEQTVLAGQVKPAQQQEAEECGLLLRDYFLREELTVANAAATAEAALQVAMERLDRTLLGMNCLILGFGRIGRLLSYRLHGLGSHVTAAARKPEDLAWIRAYGWTALEIGKLDRKISGFDAVFNTVPSMVLHAPLVAQLPRNSLCVDLASAPGIDLTAVERRGMQGVWARSLPGRMVPCTAAAVVRDAVYHMLSIEE
ncbi:MAG: dipicolinate synthase [Oscillibacter sp.]|nr:dipicolinate synthase [Oscillibacter sp.]